MMTEAEMVELAEKHIEEEVMQEEAYLLFLAEQAETEMCDIFDVLVELFGKQEKN